MAWSIGSEDPNLIADTARLVPLAGLALAAAVPAHILCAMLKAQGRSSAALQVLTVGYWGVGVTAMLAVWRIGSGASGVWVALALGAAAASVAGVIATANARQKGSGFVALLNR